MHIYYKKSSLVVDCLIHQLSQILVGKFIFLFFQSHLRAGNRGNEEINKRALCDYTSAFRQEMVTVFVCLPGISDINVSFVETVASNQVVEFLPMTPKGWAKRRDARQMPDGNVTDDGWQGFGNQRTSR